MPGQHRFLRQCRTLASAACMLFAAAGVVSAQPDASAPDSCTLEAGVTGSVVRVIDAETVLLDGGFEVRLIGALAPRSPDLSQEAQPWPPEEAATAALRELTLGQTVTLATSGRSRDRYGRNLAHLFIDRGGERVWVQGEMLRMGHARAYGLPGSHACMHELLAHENVARAAGAGLWANGAYRVRSARHTRDLLRRRNAYEIVAGEVAKVSVTKARTYINFGRDWRTDFTAGIEARVLRANPEWAKTLSALEGRRIEVRGWIQYRNGPYIDIEDPSQIAPAEEHLPGPTPPRPDAMTSSGRTAPSAKEKRPEPEAPGALDL